MKNRSILLGDVMNKIKEIPDESIDLICTDPPYGYSFMNKDWDKVVISSDVWKECLRVLKPGSFAFIMSAPRQDVLCRVMINLEKAGFVMGFTSIYWVYASGFPKAMNVSKAIDKKGGIGMNKQFCNLIKKKREESNLSTIELAELGHFYGDINHGGSVANWETGIGVPTLEQYNKLIKILQLEDYPEVKEARREVIGHDGRQAKDSIFNIGIQKEWDITKSETKQAKKLDGSYAGFQPKPALEVILVCMKPLSEKNYVEQALSNQHGVTWLDDCRIPYKNESDKEVVLSGNLRFTKVDRKENVPFEQDDKGMFDVNRTGVKLTNNQGRFPANLIVSDNVLDTGEIRKSGKLNSVKRKDTSTIYGGGKGYLHDCVKTGTFEANEGDFSRYYSLDSWEAQFLITPKPSKSEKNEGLKQFTSEQVKIKNQNTHPTVKPIELFKYLISMGSRPNDFVLDPFMGSGTTAIACEKLARKWIGIEINEKYCEIINARIENYKKQVRLFD